MEFLGNIMESILQFLYSYLNNWGLSIIGLTIAIRMLLWPLTQKQTQSMKRMQVIQPEVKKLQEKYKGNPEKMNKEVMALYGKHSVNPMSGCWPLLLQFPILIALFRVLSTMEYPVGEGAFLWIADLSNPDPIFILPVLAALTTHFNQKQMTTDPQQSKMMAFMPFMIGIFALRFPAGLALYWVASNLIAIAQHTLTSGRTQVKEEAVSNEKR